MRFSSPTKRLQAGFTLIELIIVIVIIGILAAVAIPRLTGMSEEAQISKNKAVLAALKSAWTIAYAKEGGAAPTKDDVVDQMADPVCEIASNAFTCGDASTTFPFTLNATTSKIDSPTDIKCATQSGASPVLCGSTK